MLQNLLDGCCLKNRGDDFVLPAAGAFEHVDLEDPRKQLRPGEPGWDGPNLQCRLQSDSCDASGGAVVFSAEFPPDAEPVHASLRSLLTSNDVNSACVIGTRLVMHPVYRDVACPAQGPIEQWGGTR